jgi:peptidyl-prolyl cis-trans isomerase A (cyclophilin A)
MLKALNVLNAYITRSLLVGLLACVGSMAGAQDEPLADSPASTPALVNVVMHTTLGDIVLAIETERAPITAANFLHYVDEKRFDGITFYRAMKIGDAGEYGLVQAGLRGDPKKVFKPIEHEPTTKTGLSHLNGTISMARLAPGTATAEFFIVWGNLTTLDAQPDAPVEGQGDNQGYAAFGHVIEGMDVVKQILEQPRSDSAGEGVMKGQMLDMPVKVLSVRRVMQ